MIVNTKLDILPFYKYRIKQGVVLISQYTRCCYQLVSKIVFDFIAENNINGTIDWTAYICKQLEFLLFIYKLNCLQFLVKILILHILY
jgi:hypothetical protein